MVAQPRAVRAAAVMGRNPDDCMDRNAMLLHPELPERTECTCDNNHHNRHMLVPAINRSPGMDCRRRLGNQQMGHRKMPATAGSIIHLYSCEPH